MEEKVILKRPPKSPALAGLLAFFLPTTGALYNGQPFKFIIYLIILGGLITLQPKGGQPFTAFLLAGFYFYQIFEAAQTAKHINLRFLRGEDVEEEKKVEEFPQVVKAGSIFWGLTLMALGGVLLLANFDVISYDSLFDFWPLVVIVIGLKLVTEYFTKNNQNS